MVGLFNAKYEDGDLVPDYDAIIAHKDKRIAELEAKLAVIDPLDLPLTREAFDFECKDRGGVLEETGNLYGYRFKCGKTVVFHGDKPTLKRGYLRGEPFNTLRQLQNLLDRELVGIPEPGFWMESVNADKPVPVIIKPKSISAENIALWFAMECVCAGARMPNIVYYSDRAVVLEYYADRAPGKHFITVEFYNGIDYGDTREEPGDRILMCDGFLNTKSVSFLNVVPDILHELSSSMCRDYSNNITRSNAISQIVARYPANGKLSIPGKDVCEGTMGDGYTKIDI